MNALRRQLTAFTCANLAFLGYVCGVGMFAGIWAYVRDPERVLENNLYSQTLAKAYDIFIARMDECLSAASYARLYFCKFAQGLQIHNARRRASMLAH